MNHTENTTIYQLLIYAQHQNANIRKPATSKLRRYETQNGFANALLGIVHNIQSPSHVRLLAIICLKNVVHRHWRKSSSISQNNTNNVITNEEKNYVKNQLFNCLSYPDKVITVQVCAVIAKIARIDWPLGLWPDLFPKLLQFTFSGQQHLVVLTPQQPVSLSDQNKLSNCNKAIVSLNKVLKEFLSIRVPSAKLRYQEIIFELLPVLTSDFSRNLELFVCFIQNTISSSDFRAANSDEIAILLGEISKNSLKCIYHILATEFENIIVLQSQQQQQQQGGEVNVVIKPAVANFLFNIVRWLPVIEEILNMFPHEHPVEILLRKLHVNLTRCVTVVQKISPKGFEQCGISTNNNNNSDQLIAKYFQLYFPILQRAADSMEKQMLGRISTRLVLEKAYINILQFFSHLIDKSTLTCLSSLFTNTTIQQITTMTITNFLALSEEDLIEWEDNPEQYVLKQDSLTIYERLRPAAENLYLSLVERFPEFIGPFLVQTILHKHESSVFDNNNSGGNNNSVTRSPSRINACKLDGVYLAIGLNAYALNQHLNFGEWFMNRLGK